MCQVKRIPRPPRILILLENHIYPNDVRVKPHAESLAAAGYSVTVVSPGGKGYAAYEVINDVTVYRYPASFAETRKIEYMLESLIGAFFLTLLPLWIWVRHGFDIFLFYNPPDLIWLCGMLPKLLGKILVFDLRDLTPELLVSKFPAVNPLLVRLFQRMEHWSCRMADHTIVTNESTRKLICERHNLPKERVTVIRQGPDIEKITPTQPDPALRARAEITIGYLGNMSPERGTGHLLRALHHLKYDLGYGNWHCVLIGRPIPAVNLEEMAAQLGINEQITLTGFLSTEEWVKVLSATDICVDPGPANPVNNVSTTNKIMDYMALAKPVVVFDLPERHGTAADTILYAQANDNLDLARKIALLIDSPELRTNLGNVGYERVLNSLAWHHQKKLLLSLFDQLAQKHTPYRQKQPRET